MADRKINKNSFDHGPLLKVLNKQAHIAHLSDAGRERVEAALKAGVEAEMRKHGLQYGVGDKHADALEEFPTSNKYADRRFLKPKEREMIKKSLSVFFNRKPAEKTEKRSETLRKAQIEAPQKIEPTLPEPPPEVSNDDAEQLAA